MWNVMGLEGLPIAGLVNKTESKPSAFRNEFEPTSKFKSNKRAYLHVEWVLPNRR